MDIYSFQDYKEYLRFRVGPRQQRRGVKSALARALSCQPTYVSQVIYGSAHFSLEQAEGLGRYFGHGQEETEYFFLLVQKARAGTEALRNHFQGQMNQILQRRMILIQRLGKQDSIPEEHRAVYYSVWYYTAIHIGLTVPHLQTVSAISEWLQLPKKKVSEVVDFLVRTNLATIQDGGIRPGTSTVRLGNDSQHIIRHHASFRQKAIEALEREELTDLHYSAAITLSKADITKIKDRILESLKENLEIIKASPEEELYAYNIDFFSLRRN